VTLVVIPGFGLAVTAQEPDRNVSRALRAAMQSLDLSDLGDLIGSGNQDPDFTAEETSSQTVNLPIGSTGTVAIENLSGDVTITAANRSDVAVEITKRSRGRTSEDAARGLAAVEVEVDQRGDRATIETHYPSEDESPYSVSVFFEIAAPAGTRFTVESIAGDVSADGISGELSLSTTAGDITIRNAGNVDRAHTVAGSVRLTNVVADGTLEAESVSGSVIAEQVTADRLSLSSVTGDVVARDATVERAEIHTMTGSAEYEGHVANGGRYELQSQSGEVTFRATGGAGFELRASTFGGSIRPASSLGLEPTDPPNRALKGTVGDGSALVVLTTFGGDVIISR
jgi:hypothetical protein